MNVAETSKRGDPALLRNVVATLGERLDDLVSITVVAHGDRRLHAAAIGGLIAVGLLVAIMSPVMAMAGTNIVFVVAPLLLSGLFLGAAAGLSVSGALDSIAFACATMAIATIAAAGAWGGGPLVMTLLVAAILPSEALVFGRRRLGVWLTLSVLVAVPGAVAFVGAETRGAFAEIVAATVLALYVATLMLRAARRRPSDRDEAAMPLDDEPDAAPSQETTVEIDPGGRIRNVSTMAADILDIAETALIERPFLDLVHVGDRLGCLKAMKDATKGSGEPTLCRLRRADGQYLDAALSFLVDDRRVTTARFVTLSQPEPGESADMLKEALEAANQSSTAKSQFLATVSHELRTPLNAIIGFSDILDQEIFGGFQSDRQKEYVGLIRQSGQHLLSVVNGLLDVSKIEAGRYELQPESVDFAAVMARACDVVRDAAERKKLRLDLRASGSGPENGGQAIVADPRACHQILLNLLSNAVKFTDIGVVTLECRRVEDVIEVCVSDTGIGIASDDVARLGRPFTQVSSGTAKRYEGTGLGLSLVKGLAELHGGTMSICSQPSIGTMVTVRLPVDCTKLAGSSRPLQENVVALDHARTKSPSNPSPRAPRRTA